MLKVNDINVYYGAIHAIQGVSFEVNEGEIVTLIGANGAGKSTIIKTISGLLRSKTGSISFQGIPYLRLNRKNRKNGDCACSGRPQNIQAVYGRGKP